MCHKVCPVWSNGPPGHVAKSHDGKRFAHTENKLHLCFDCCAGHVTSRSGYASKILWMHKLTKAVDSASPAAARGRTRRGGLGLGAGDAAKLAADRGLSCQVPPKGLLCSTAPSPISMLAKDLADTGPVSASCVGGCFESTSIHADGQDEGHT